LHTGPIPAKEYGVHIRIRRSFLFRIALTLVFSFFAVGLLLALIAEAGARPDGLQRVTGFDSFADFVAVNLGGMLAGLLVGFLLLLLVRRVLFSRRLRGPVVVLREALQNVEHGMLDTRLQVERSEDFFAIAEDFNMMRDALEGRLRRMERALHGFEDVEFNLTQLRVNNSLGPKFVEDQLVSLKKHIAIVKKGLEGVQFSSRRLVPRVLVIGGGGREHALVSRIIQSSMVEEVWVSPGNAGIWQIAKRVDLPLVAPFHEVVDFCVTTSIDLVVVGPEQPLVDGIADALRAADVPVFGPGAAGARLEGSKQYAKKIMEKYKIPTAAWREFDSFEKACAWVDSHPGPWVLKADGLAAGKGVAIVADPAEAHAVLRSYLVDGVFGEAGRRVVIEECLQGEEVSVLAFTDGLTMRVLPTAQDHKRIGDGDTGPNTGGMGAYAPAPVVSPALMKKIEKRVLKPMMEAFHGEGIDYRGILYAGLMLTRRGPYVIEFNCRFGDPETQVVLPLVKTDLVQLLVSTARGRLQEVPLECRDGSACCVVLAADGYPGHYKKGHVIGGLEEAAETAEVFHAGTVLNPAGHPATAGGRVLGVTAVRDTLGEAIAVSYQAAEKITFKGMQYRKDIGRRGLERLARNQKGRLSWIRSRF
jgi:phosphoribosylamine--glycine ligase